MHFALRHFPRSLSSAFTPEPISHSMPQFPCSNVSTFIFQGISQISVEITWQKKIIEKSSGTNTRQSSAAVVVTIKLESDLESTITLSFSLPLSLYLSLTHTCRGVWKIAHASSRNVPRIRRFFSHHFCLNPSLQSSVAGQSLGCYVHAPTKKIREHFFSTRLLLWPQTLNLQYLHTYFSVSFLNDETVTEQRRISDAADTAVGDISS